MKYITERAYQVGTIYLPAGTISFGFYFEDEPFVLYRWFSPEGNYLGDYFSVADEIKITEEEFSWRDLFVDVLIHPEGKAEVLDENEVSENLKESFQAYIRNAKERVLRSYPLILEKVTEMMENLIWRKT